MYNKNHKALLYHRMMVGKFLRIPPEEKEKYRAEFNRIRDEYEMQHLGSFEKIYPTDDAAKAKHFEDLLKFQKKTFDDNYSYNPKKNNRTNILNSSQSKSPNKRILTFSELQKSPEQVSPAITSNYKEKPFKGIVPFNTESELEYYQESQSPTKEVQSQTKEVHSPT